jgi:predicted Fe-Mo cluster-binding NifX family protein
MKIAVSATGQTIDADVEARFGRCPYFLIVDPATLDVETIANDNAELGGGAGIQSAQLIAEKEASVVLTGNCGPNAMEVFNNAGIEVITGVSGTVSEAVQQFSAGSLKAVAGGLPPGRYSSQTGQSGMRGTRKSGRCMGGGGRGMGGGGGRGMGGGRRCMGG